MSGWIGVDLDGTLAEYHGWIGVEHIGPPIEPMVERVRTWLRAGVPVRIFTARVSGQRARDESLPAIEAWCIAVFGTVLPVTNVKDFGMIELWDDRAVAVEHNTGRVLRW